MEFGEGDKTVREIKYFHLTIETDRKKIGEYPQVDIVKNITKDKLNSFSNLSVEYFPDDPPDLNYFCFKREAKETDLISNGYIDLSKGLVINERLKSIIDQYKLINVQYYIANIKRDQKIHPYFYLHILESSEFIGFPQSTFGVGDPLGRPKGPTFMVDDLVELTEKVNELVANSDEDYVIPISIFLKQEIDFVRVPFDVNIYMSEELVTRFIKDKITGFIAEETKVKFFID